MLLLLSLGLEYSADELMAGLRHNHAAGFLDLVLNAVPGAALALLLGWGPVAAVALAGVTYVSSSGIVAKLLADLGHLGNRETPIVIAVLVFEDLAMAAYLPVLAALISGLGVLAATANLVLALGVVVTVFVIALRFPGVSACCRFGRGHRGDQGRDGLVAVTRVGIGHRGRLRADIALIPRGEFTIIIAGLTTTAAGAGLIAVDNARPPGRCLHAPTGSNRTAACPPPRDTDLTPPTSPNWDERVSE